MKITAIVASLLLGSLASATCLDNKTVDRVMSPFQVVRWNGEKLSSAITLKDLCDENDHLYKLAQAMIFTEQMESESGGPQPKADSVVAREGAFSFFKSRIKMIILEDKPMANGACSANGVQAFVSTREGHVTHVCNMGFEYFTPFALSGILIHEARHVEGYSHAHCSHGSLAGKDLNTSGGCDTDYPSQGSYGIGTGFAVHVMKTTHNEVLKQQARGQAVDDFVQRFNKYPWDLKPGLLTASQDAKNKPITATFFDGQSVTTMPNFPQPNEEAVFVSRFGSPTFFFKDGSVKSYGYSPKLGDTQGSIAEDYRKKSTPAERNDLVDVYYGADYACNIFSQTVKCNGVTDDGQKTTGQISLNGIKPYTIIAMPTSPTSARQFLVDVDGNLYKMPNASSDLPQWRASDLVLDPSRGHLFGYTKTETNQTYGIDQSQSLITLQNGQWNKVPQYNGKSVKKVMPFVWSKTLEAL